MELRRVSTGVFIVHVPEAKLDILCGCPPDIVKTLMKRGFILETSQDGVVFETGPNAILLSDITVQGGVFCNMAEFPVLHMYYNQGMILPHHPNNTGRKPIIIGLSQQLQAQSTYLFRGTYGLANEAEMVENGIKPEVASEIVKYKNRFAGGKVRQPEETIDFFPVDSGSADITGGVRVERRGVNLYTFRYGKESVDVDLNLKSGENYEAPVKLDYHKVKLDYFSVLHIGEGNGWDKDRPCMSSIVIFQGKIYLIDTGPNILNSLTALGISVNEIEGIFHTHAHDDHFAGLTSLTRTDHRLKYYATPLIRASVMKKLSALTSQPEKSFANTFDFKDLRFNKWNNIDGLEVMPVLSLHPVETTILIFRALWEGGYKTYVHLADIPSLKVMDDYLIKADDATILASRLREDLSEAMFSPADVKKVDAGGGSIHGDARDFEGDRSAKIVLSHTSSEFTNEQKEIGSNAAFGTQDVLIKSTRDYTLPLARGYLESHFPNATKYDLDMLLNCPVMSLNSGEFVIRKGIETEYLYLVLGGVVELIDAARDIQRNVSAGTLIGELSALRGETPSATYRTKSFASLLQIPADLYIGFVQRNLDIKETLRLSERTLFLQGTWLFGEAISSTVQNRIAQVATELRVRGGDKVGEDNDDCLYLVREGQTRLMFDETQVDVVGPGQFFGEESVFFKRSSMMTAFAVKNTQLFVIPAQILSGIPVAVWKLLEVYERRLMSFGSLVSKS